MTLERDEMRWKVSPVGVALHAVPDFIEEGKSGRSLCGLFAFWYAPDRRYEKCRRCLARMER